ncbi:hypothetical protein K474DRAFT_1589476 [Panus rudis PR-1116 ss-1]|nr:hypothetical protein K474DRAFT_1589476 [Panus rudis PR-1116 ss-1]
MPSSLYVPMLVAGMLITGSSNSLWSKWQDMQCVENCDDPNPRHHVLYEQPIWQTLQMFLGEMLCFLPLLFTWLNSKRRSQPVQLPQSEDEDDQEEDASHPGSSNAKDFPDAGPQQLRGWRYLLLWLPAACDLTGTTLMNVGLLYTPVSIYQMTRGALVLFVGSLSVIFLRRRLWLYQWVSLITVMAGVSLVGYAGSLIKDPIRDESSGLLSAPLPPPEPVDEPQVGKVLVGVFFVLFAQIFTATQLVVEEKIMARYTVSPDIAVGFEGLFGFLTILVALPFISISPLADPKSSTYSPFFDLPRGWAQMIYTPTVLYSGIAIAISISLFNWFGLSVTRRLSATARSLTDTCRTLSIWLVSLGLGWEKIVFPISFLQVVGFGLLVYGTFLFNGLVNAPSFLRPAEAEPEITPEESRHLLAEHALDETAALPADLGQSGFDIVPPPEQEAHARSRSRSRARAD